MQKPVQSQVCLMMNLGGFEERMEDNVDMAQRHGKFVYSLTTVGISPSEEVPLNVMTMTKDELLHWTAHVNLQLQEKGFDLENVVILAAGRVYRGILPGSTHIMQGVGIGA